MIVRGRISITLPDFGSIEILRADKMDLGSELHDGVFVVARKVAITNEGQIFFHKDGVWHKWNKPVATSLYDAALGDNFRPVFKWIKSMGNLFGAFAGGDLMRVGIAIGAISEIFQEIDQ